MNWWVSDWSISKDSATKQVEWDAVVSAFSGKDGVGWLRARCPMCEEASGSDDVKESLGFNTRTAGYNCYKCLSKGRLPTSYVEQLDGLVDFDLNDDGRQVVAPLPVEPPTGFAPLYNEAGMANVALESVREYARGRGISDETGRAMGLGTGIGKLTGRLVVPIVDPDGTYRGWYGRDITGLSPIPHRYAKGMVREGLLFNARQIERDTDEPLFVVEGCLKTVPVWPDTVATLGKPLDSHIEPLLRGRRPLVVCLDGDAWREGQAFTWKLKCRGRVVQNLQLLAKSDPDDFSRDWLLTRARALLKGD